MKDNFAEGPFASIKIRRFFWRGVFVVFTVVGVISLVFECHRAAKEKEVLAIHENPKYAFTGFENIVLTFRDLREIISDQILYENWHTTLSSVYAIYFITDQVSGKHYVGSAYGTGGLLGRWKNYIETHHVGNKRMIELLKLHQERYFEFQFSLLQIIPKSFTTEDVINLESLYKRKLKSIEFGLNGN